MKKVLIGYGFSGIVQQAFEREGFFAVSCDLLPTESSTKHLRMDIHKAVYEDDWDLAIFFPPCTYLAVSGARWWADRLEEQEEALAEIRWLMSLDIPCIAIENPIGKISTAIRKPDQIIQPWQFGHGEVKATCFWLKGLPLLVPTDIVSGRNPRVFLEGPSPERSKNRSRTLNGVASAMAKQWGT